MPSLKPLGFKYSGEPYIKTSDILSKCSIKLMDQECHVLQLMKRVDLKSSSQQAPSFVDMSN
jgi:hypothetical protein